MQRDEHLAQLQVGGAIEDEAVRALLVVLQNEDDTLHACMQPGQWLLNLGACSCCAYARVQTHL